jgi:uncharacterized protein with beta-barrel porin domain
VRSRFGLSVATVSLGVAAFAPSAAFAACTPGTGDNVTVTCSGAVFNQGPEAGTGYGSGLQNGLTINVVATPPSSVIGTTFGIDVGNNNTINNFGTVNGSGSFAGINGGTALTVNNSGTIGFADIAGNIADLAGIFAITGLVVTNTTSGIIQGNTGVQGNSTANVTNSGLIQGVLGGDGINVGGGSVTVNNLAGTITGNANGITADVVTVTHNFGTISAPAINGFFGGTAINATTSVNVTNDASGIITSDGSAITAPTAVVTNFGTISGTGLGASGIAGGTVTVTNSGSILSSSGAAAISMTAGTIVNNVGGIISGDLGISAFGGTSIFNAGTITGAAGTAIFFFSGGNTLTLGPGSVINGTAQGTGADTFQLGGTGTDSFNASLFATQYSGYATFNKIGASTWTLTGSNATAMPWTISGGTLVVDGTLANSTMTVSAGGTLAGSGIIGNTVITGGTLAPGSAGGNVFGPLSVLGNLSFTAASTYMIQVSPANAGRTNVTGTATLGGATVSALFAAGSYVSRQYTILNATGNVAGTFSSLVNTNLPANFTSSLSYDAKDAYLNLALNYAPSSSPNFGGGLNANQHQVANALTNFFNATGGIPLVFGTLNPGGLTQASGEVATGSQQTTFDAMNQFMGLLTDPFIAGRSDGATGGAGATPFAEESDGANAYAANGKARPRSERDAYGMITKAPPMADPFAQRWSVWAAGFGGSQTTDGNAPLGSNSVTSRIAGTAVGADYRFSPFTIAGFALAGGGTSFSLANALGSGRSDLFQAGAFVRHTAGPAYISAALAYGWQDTTTDRIVTAAGIDHLHAEFNANAFSGRVEGGYRFVTPWMNGVGITPYGAAQFTTFDLPAYAEQALTGANTFALAYGPRSVTDPRSELGLRTDKSFATQDGILTLRGRFAWAHDYDPDPNIAATFQTLPGASFVVNGAAQASDSALTTASVEMKWLNGWSAAATFEGEFSSVTASYAGKGVVRYAW